MDKLTKGEVYEAAQGRLTDGAQDAPAGVPAVALQFWNDSGVYMLYLFSTN
jgi:hypothetical protein